MPRLAQNKCSLFRPGAASKQLPPLKGKGKSGEQDHGRCSGEEEEEVKLRRGEGEEGRGREVMRGSSREGRRRRGKNEEQDLATRCISSPSPNFLFYNYSTQIHRFALFTLSS